MKKITKISLRSCVTGILLSVSLSASSVSYGAAQETAPQTVQAAARRAAYESLRDSQLITLAGGAGRGLEDGSKDHSRFSAPLGIDVRDGTVIITDTENNLIRSYHGNRTVTYAGRVAGRDAYGAALGGFRDSSYGLARFNKPSDCVWLPNGQAAIADRDNNAIRIAGRAWIYTLNGTGESGYQEGAPGKAMFSMPSGIAADNSGNLYVADTGNHCIRKIRPDGHTSLAAGVPGQSGLKDGGVREALFTEPSSIAVAEDGSLYVADTGNQRIRRIADGQVTTLAGGSMAPYLDTEYRRPGLKDGEGQEAEFWFPEGICMAGPVAVVADTGNHVIRAVSPQGYTQVIAGTGEAGWQDGPALEGALNRPADVAWEDGILYIMDSGGNALRSMEFEPQAWLESLEGHEPV